MLPSRNNRQAQLIPSYPAHATHPDAYTKVQQQYSTNTHMMMIVLVLEWKSKKLIPGNAD